MAVLTARAPDGAPHGLTINSFSALSLDPPLVMVAIDRLCGFLNTFESSGCYAVNILREEQRDLSIRFAQLPEGRFAGVAWRPGTATDSPIIEAVLGVIECRILRVLDVGDHRMLIGEVVEIGIGDGRPLVFFRSEYRGLSSG